MNKLKLLIFSLLACVGILSAQTGTKLDSTSGNPADEAFSKMFISIEGGEVYPWGDLLDAIEDSYYGGFGFRYSYWHDVDGFVSATYSYFKPVPGDVPFDGVHQVSGKLGADWHAPFLNPIVLGFGFTCNWTRADLDNQNKKTIYKLPGGTLTDNETEFGWFARLNVPLWNWDKFRVGFNLQWEELWTLPKRSDMMTAGFYVERRIW